MDKIIPAHEIHRLIAEYKRQLANATGYGGEYAQGQDSQLNSCIDDLNEILKKYEG